MARFVARGVAESGVELETIRPSTRSDHDDDIVDVLGAGG
jgi:hypothetical protein